MPLDQLARVVGMANSDLLLPDQPRAAQNRRITITVLTKEAERRVLGLGQTETAENADDAIDSLHKAATSALARKPAAPATQGSNAKVIPAVQTLGPAEEFVTSPEVVPESVEKPDNARPSPRD